MLLTVICLLLENYCHGKIQFRGDQTNIIAPNPPAPLLDYSIILLYRKMVRFKNGANFSTNFSNIRLMAYTRKNAQLVFPYWQAGIWRLELVSLNIVELANLNMIELANLNLVWAGQLEHGCWQACSCMLEQAVHCWNHHKSTALFMHDRTSCQGMMK